MTPALDPKQVAMTNPAVDVRKIEHLQAVRRIMENAGVAKKADYRLDPPLGIGPAKTPSSGAFVIRLRHDA